MRRSSSRTQSPRQRGYLDAYNSIEAGFDGVEVQAANSHLIDQFLQDGTNKRTDEYGGTAENRLRFLLEVVDKVCAAIGINRLGVRLSPFGQYGGIQDSNPLHLYGIAISALDKRQLAYLHLIEGRGSEIGLGGGLHEEALNNAQLFRPNFRGPLISAAAYTRHQPPKQSLREKRMPSLSDDCL